MAKLVSMHGHELRYDPRHTRRCYSRIEVPGPEACGCAYCHNWVAARATVLTPGLSELLNELNIPHDGEIAVWHTPGTTKDNFYGGWYMFVGSIVQRPSAEKEFSVDNFRLTFKDGHSYPVPAFNGFNVCELHFNTEIDTFIDRKLMAG